MGDQVDLAWLPAPPVSPHPHPRVLTARENLSFNSCTSCVYPRKWGLPSPCCSFLPTLLALPFLPSTERWELALQEARLEPQHTTCHPGDIPRAKVPQAYPRHPLRAGQCCKYPLRARHLGMLWTQLCCPRRQVALLELCGWGET